MRGPRQLWEPSNKHHVVPSSRGGSDEKLNITDVAIARHARFHQVFGILTPCEVARFAAIAGINYEGRTLHPACIDTIFQITTMRKWEKLYQPGTFVTPTNPEGLERSQRAASYKLTHLKQESVLLRNAMHSLVSDCEQANTSQFVGHLLEFFKRKRPESALRAYYNEERGNRLTWVRTLQGQTRRDLLKELDFESTPFHHSMRQQLLDVLEKQEKDYIQRYIREWEEKLGQREFHDLYSLQANSTTAASTPLAPSQDHTAPQ